MPLTYQYQLDGQVSEPVIFQVLVDLVREEKLAADDLVKAEWEKEWHAAAELIGLFYMAKRTDLLEIWEEQQIEKRRHEREHELRLQALKEGILDADSINEMLAGAEELSHFEKELTDEQINREAAIGQYLQGQISQVTAEAMSTAAGQDSNTQRSRRWNVFRLFASTQFPRLLLLIGLPVLVMNLVGFGLIRWSDSEALRFPSRNQQLSHYFLPILGRCSELEFWIGVGNCVVMAGLFSLITAVWLERQTDG